MTATGPDFRQTWLWRQAFQTPRSDSTPEEQDYFRTQYLSIRERAGQLVSRISADMPGLTVHDISHLDALWDTASSVAEGAVNVNPAEAFVLGASILLHDAAMSLAAYPGGLSDLKKTLAWRDAVARLALASEETGKERFDVANAPDAVVQRVLPNVLRQLHAERAEELAEQAWKSPDGSSVHLVEDTDLRTFYGPTIGQIAHSHWWSVQRLEQEFSEDLGALANRTRNRVDRLMLACLLRVADAIHLDSRRAPRFLRAITNPSGISALHWAFQERLARPHIELDAVVFTTGQPFGRKDAEAWWLAYDTLNAVDRELHDVDLLLQGRGREILKARRVKLHLRHVAGAVQGVHEHDGPARRLSASADPADRRSREPGRAPRDPDLSRVARTHGEGKGGLSRGVRPPYYSEPDKEHKLLDCKIFVDLTCPHERYRFLTRMRGKASAAIRAAVCMPTYTATSSAWPSATSSNCCKDSSRQHTW